MQASTGGDGLGRGTGCRAVQRTGDGGGASRTCEESEYLSEVSGAGESAWRGGEICEESSEGNQYVLYCRTVAQIGNQNVRCLILYSPLYDTREILDDVSGLVFLIIAVMAAVSIIIVWFVAGSISGPVRRLCEAARGGGAQ